VDAALAQQIRTHCLNWLARREHSRKELSAKLAAKGFSPDDCQDAIDDLAQQGWQSDRRYAESYARSRIRKGYGPIAIGFELNRNGIDEVDLDGIAEAEGGWQNLLEQVYRKKYHESPANPAEWAKRSRFLLQRGFPAAMIKDLFAELQGRRERICR